MSSNKVLKMLKDLANEIRDNEYSCHDLLNIAVGMTDVIDLVRDKNKKVKINKPTPKTVNLKS